MRPSGAKRYCAIYTRKSSEEGLEQEFNSLDAQREAAAAFVKSQSHEGWRLLKTAYDDGGYSGGNLQRPGLVRLLADIDVGKVDIIVVYKVDRLTRSLNDFAKLIEVFEAHGVSFVSVTQQFNTTTSMGRLMLNVLLSFAQFEREVTGERIRDKIAASKKKGMWMGGVPPLGYEVRDRALVVQPSGAALVRHIFERFLELGSVSALVGDLEKENRRTRLYTSASGRRLGGRPFSRGHVHRILTNRIYLGETVHRRMCYPGRHEAIIDRTLWGKVQALIASNRNGFKCDKGMRCPSLLKGILYDDAGNRMSPSRGVKGQRQYRYYVSQALIQNRRQDAGSLPRLPAPPLEKLVLEAMLKSLSSNTTTQALAGSWERAEETERRVLARRLIRRVVVEKGKVQITINPTRVDHGDTAAWAEAGEDAKPVSIEVPFELVERGGSCRLIVDGDASQNIDGPNPALVRAIARGLYWREQLLGGHAPSIAELAKLEKVSARYVSRMLRFAFLAPDITEAILSGEHCEDLNLELFRKPIPLDWNEQRRLFGLATG